MPSTTRAREYARLAEQFHELADASPFPELQAELRWLASSYERLANAPELTRVAGGFRSLEIAEPTLPPNTLD